MIELVKSIFKAKGFNYKEGSAFFLFTSKDVIGNWIVKEIDNLLFNDTQDELFIEAKKLVEGDSTFDKNTSLLLLYKVEDSVERSKLKHDILTIEEDPYQFKKHVLIYTDNEIIKLKEKLESNSYDKLRNLISNSEVFESYKKNNDNYSWESLIYRLTHKIPFIDIDVEEGKSLTSLFDENAKLIVKKGVEKFNNLFESNFENMSATEISQMDDLEEILNLLQQNNNLDELENK